MNVLVISEDTPCYIFIFNECDSTSYPAQIRILINNDNGFLDEIYEEWKLSVVGPEDEIEEIDNIYYIDRRISDLNDVVEYDILYCVAYSECGCKLEVMKTKEPYVGI